MLVAHSDSSIVPLSKSTPDVETPSLKPLWRELSRVVQHNLQTVLGYDLLAGQRVLREQIARLMLDSGSVVTADDIIITSGCHNSMSMALMAVCNHLHRHSGAVRAPAARLWRTDVLFSHQRFLGHLCRPT